MIETQTMLQRSNNVVKINVGCKRIGADPQKLKPSASDFVGHKMRLSLSDAVSSSLSGANKKRGPQGVLETTHRETKKLRKHGGTSKVGLQIAKKSSEKVTDVGEKNPCPCKTPPTTDIMRSIPWQDDVQVQLSFGGRAADSKQTISLCDAQLSPKRALRAALLKRQFADTILRAQEKLSNLQGHGTRDPLKMKHEKTILELRQRQYKAQIEAEYKAAEAAVGVNAEVELKKQRAKKREEAQITLEKVKKTVELHLDTEILDEIQRWTEFSSYAPSPLEQLGLFIKPEYSQGEDDLTFLDEEEREEGEIY